MAADCMTRVWALAIATAACIGLPSALIYAIVRIAAARRYGATFALGLVLVFWVTVSAAYYPRVCADLVVPWLRFLRRRAREGQEGDPSSLLVPQQRPWFVVTIDEFPWPRQAPATAARGAVIIVPAPPPRHPSYEQQRVPLAQRSHGDDRASTTSRITMVALPREPPAARGGEARDYQVPRPPPCVEQSDGGGPYCAICQADVDEEETAKQLPLCLHVFHRHCIDQWLQAHSTCPICRSTANLTDSCTSLYGR